MLDVRLDSVSVHLNGSQNLILTKINFKIVPGFIYTILGKNGSGKSTLIKSLTNLLLKNAYEVSGKCVFNGVDLLNADEEQLRQIRINNIRYVFQDTINSFDPLRKLDYYLNSFAKDKIKAEELLKYFLLPPYDQIRKLYPYELSGGMAQRLSLILALLADPELIILDEPTSAVDPAITNLVLLKLKEFLKEKNKSVLIVTQDILFASAVSDYLAMISEKTLTQFLPKVKFFQEPIDDRHNSLLLTFKEIKA